MDFLNSLMPKIEMFIQGIKSFFTKKEVNIEKSEKFDISIDEIQSQYKKIPKRLVYLTIGAGVFAMLTMTVLTVKEQAANVDKQRKAVDNSKLKQPEGVQIKIDEQAWKHYQNKKIEILAEKTTKQIEETKDEMRKNSEKMTEEVKEELKNTVANVENVATDMKNMIENFEQKVTDKVDKEISSLDNKFKNEIDANKKLIEAQKANAAAQANNLIGIDPKLLPPPLKSLNQESTAKKRAPKKIEHIEPGSNEYTYENVEIDKVSVIQSDISTALLPTQSDPNKIKNKFHIMKGLVNATLLTGINAPTFAGADSKLRPPVLLSVDGDTLISNDETQTIDNCLIGGSATGNINSSTADILLTDISCSGYDINGNKIKIEQKIEGWVIGENGGLGLEGMLLDSSGKVITKMIALEIIDSLSKTMQAAALPSGTTTFGTSSANIPYDDSATKGLGKGVSSGIGKAFEHYNQILTGMYPTISVMAGKKIALYLKGGEDLTPSSYDNINIYNKFEIQAKDSNEKNEK